MYRFGGSTVGESHIHREEGARDAAHAIDRRRNREQAEDQAARGESLAEINDGGGSIFVTLFPLATNIL